MRQELRATESCFFGPQVVQANYKNLYSHLEPPTLYFITKTLRDTRLTTGGKKKSKNRSRYINYPQRALDKLGKVVLGIDFVGPRYLKNNSDGVHFLSRKYIGPAKYGLISLCTSIPKPTVNPSPTEIEQRCPNWQPPDPKTKTGFLALYAKLALPADEGAAMQNWSD